ncbi:MAG: translation initiation factor IF-2 [Cytophagales bacterium]|nr:translation initiation factor IF-2 [Bernardetiaceae bacterium]MDW8210403.1 translation initiation factor IF-2 [Cytophagales bacterium]
MAETKTYRLGIVARDFGVTTAMLVDFLASKGIKVDNNPNTKITAEQYAMAEKEFAASAAVKKEASNLHIGKSYSENIVISSESQSERRKEEEEEKIISIKSTVSFPAKKENSEKPAKEPEKITAKPIGLKIIGKVDLGPKKPPKEEKKATKQEIAAKRLEKIAKPTSTPVPKELPSTEEVEAAAQSSMADAAPETAIALEPIPQPEEMTASAAELTPPVALEEVTTAEVPPSLETPKQEEEVAKESLPVLAQETAADSVKKVATETSNGSDEVIRAEAERLQGLKIIGKIELPPEKEKKKNKPVASSDEKEKSKRKRKRIKAVPAAKPEASTPSNATSQKNAAQPQQRPQAQPQQKNTPKKGSTVEKAPVKEKVSEKDIQENIKNTLARLTGTGARQAVKKIKRDKKESRRQEEQADQQKKNVLQVTEFISTNELANLMGVSVNQIIAKCLSFGMFVGINQRLDAEAITIIADEFGYDVEFISAEEEIAVITEEEDREEDLQPRAPIVTIMGHVDHGKTTLLDYIRKSKVAEAEAGGITQHIGAYDVTTSSGKRIVFLDTPGHEAFTAMRARGAKLTDVAIIVIAADDDVMPQTKEAINHAQAAGVPIVFAINKIDKPEARPEKIKESLAKMNLLVEDWGGRYQCQEISAKKGIGVDELLEKVLLEAELLDLKANPNKKAVGTVIEASLDKGKGYVATVMVQAGTLRKGDVILAGAHYGRVKALMDHRGKIIQEAGPSTPVQVLGLNGAPQAGDKFNVMESEREAKEIALRREQILREQSIRAAKRTTLSDIGRRIALGNFKQLNIIVKGDVDGSVEALSEALMKLSTEEIEVKIISKSVGQISESDVLLAAASNAVIIGFQVRPSPNARKMAEKEQIEVRLYSIIYDAINDVKDAIEGMLAPTIEEVVVGNAEVLQVFKISKVGNVAGCRVTDGVIKRGARIRLIRDGIVIYGGDKNGGEIASLRREKEDVAEVKAGYECGIAIKNFNDIKVGDVIEAFEQREVKRKLS